MRQASVDPRNAAPELVPLTELRNSLQQFQRANGNSKTGKPLDTATTGPAAAGPAAPTELEVDFPSSYNLALDTLPQPNKPQPAEPPSPQAHQARTLLSLELIQLLLQVSHFLLPTRADLREAHSDAFLLALLRAIYAAWDSSKTPHLIRCRGAMLALLNLAQALGATTVRSELEAMVLADPWLHKRSINCFQLLASISTVDDMSAFNAPHAAASAGAGLPRGATNRLAVEGAAGQVLRRLTEGMASSDEIATLSGKVGFEWIDKVWTEKGDKGDLFWTGPVAEALHSSDRGRTNVCLYLLKPLFQARPHALRELLDASGFDLEQRGSGGAQSENDLETALAMIKIANSLGLVQLEDRTEPSPAATTTASTSAGAPAAGETSLVRLPIGLISTCLHHSSSSLRCSAFSLLVVSSSPLTPIPAAVFSLLRAFYSYSLGDDDPEFRQQSLALSGKLILRLRESSWKALKARDGSGQAYIAQVQQFLQALAQELLEGLNPARPYRIKMNALRLFDILLQAQLDPSFGVDAEVAAGYSSYRKTAPTPMPDFNSKHRRDGAAYSGKADKSQPASAAGPAWPFAVQLVSASSTTVLLRVLQSTYTALRALAISHLERFPSPLPGYAGTEGEANAQCELLEPALRMVRNAREAEASAGAGVIALVWRKFVLEGGAKWNLGQIGGWAKAGAGDDRGALAFLSDLMDLIEIQIDAHASDLGKAASTTPMHGTLLALRHLFIALPPASLVTLASAESRREVFHRALKLVERVWAVTSPVLAAAAPEETGTLADTEEARALLAVEGDAVDGTETSTSFGPLHKMILSASWRAMKEAGELLETILRLPSELGVSGFQAIWSLDDVEHIGALFATWLARVRHRGAFMAIHPCYSRAAAALLLCRDWPEAQALPLVWLDGHIESIVSQKISITRRSAGIPYCILGLLTAVLPVNRAAFDGAFARLFDIAESQGGEILDESRVHAMNTIRTTILDSKAAAAVGPYFERAFLLSISLFWSENWICRNVALLLYGTLVNRAFNAQRVNLDRDHHSLTKRLTVTDFFGRYPRLHSFLLTELGGSISGHLDDLPSFDLHSSLFSVLMLLSLLQSPNRVERGKQSLSDPFIPLVKTCVKSRVWKIRDAAGDALTGLVPLAEVSAVCVDLLAAVDSLKENELHGTLVQVLRLLQAAGPGLIDGENVDEALGRLSESILSQRHSFAVRTTFLDIIRTCQAAHGHADKTALQLATSTFAESRSWPEERMHLPSAENFVAAAYRLLLAVLAPSTAQAQVESVLAGGLGSRFLEVQRDALGWLAASSSASEHARAALEPQLVSLALDEWHAAECRIAAMSLIDAVPAGQDGPALVEKLLGQHATTVIVPLREAILPLVAKLIPTAAVDRTADLLSRVAAASGVEESVESRESAAYALRAFAASPKATAHLAAQSALQAMLDHLLLRLVQDDDDTVRDTANEVVTLLYAGGVSLCDRRAVELLLARAGETDWSENEEEREWRTDLEQIVRPSELLFAVERPNIFKDELLEERIRGEQGADSEERATRRRTRLAQLEEALRRKGDGGPLGWSGDDVVMKWVGRLTVGAKDGEGSAVGEVLSRVQL